MKKRIYFNMCCIAIATLFLSSFLMVTIFYRIYTEQVSNEIADEISYISSACNLLEDKAGYLENLSLDLNTRITLVDQKGAVIYDSLIDDISELENHGERPEVKEAFLHGNGYSNRSSTTLEHQNFYYARLLEDGTVLRLSGITESIFTTFLRSVPVLIGIGILILALALVLANQMTRSIIEPINELDLSNPILEGAYPELEPLLKKIRKQNKQLRKQMDAMQEQQETFRTITQHMSEGLILVDKDSNIIYINPSCREVLSAPHLDYIGKNILFLSRSSDLETSLQKAIEGTPNSSTIEVDKRYLQLIANPVIEEEQIKGAVLFILDITEKQRAEIVRKEFSANVSHELKTPLTSISGYAELMMNQMVKEEDIIAFSRKIYKEADRLITLVNDIIKISKLDEKHVVELKEEVNLLQIIKNVKERLMSVAAISNIEIAISEEAVFLKAVPQMMDELIYNLCENAIKYNIESGRVQISVKRENQHIQVEVTDTGIGIPPDHQERIFERFYRVDKSHSKQTGGTGLGLAIVKHIVEYHNGYIELHSKLGEGTTITIHFFEEVIM
jgi:two-component system phosphate regulon sensor histidine kinase PhoR